MLKLRGDRIDRMEWKMGGEWEMVVDERWGMEDMIKGMETKL